MNDKLDPQFDSFTRKVMNQSELEAPSIDFTHNLMEQIKSESALDTLVYKPLISIKMWIFIGVATILASIVTILSGQTQFNWITDKGLSFFENLRSSGSNLTIEWSSTALYTMGAIAFLLIIQFVLFKNYLHKRLQF